VYPRAERDCETSSLSSSTGMYTLSLCPEVPLEVAVATTEDI
jgi:hypothetical protein